MSRESAVARRARWAIGLVAVACLGVLGWRIAREAWVTDDALIAFRYAENLVAGRGLVFNPGERVEAFSSPLFVALLAVFGAVGADPFPASQALGALATLVELVLLLGLLWRQTRGVLAPAVAGAFYCTERMVAVWATGGLETATFSALLFACFACSCLPRARAPREAVATALHVLLAAARPEGLAFYPLYLGIVIRRGWRDGSWRSRAARSLLGTGTFVAVLVVARLLYYGRLLPHTFDAKVVGVPLGGFGTGYLGHFVERLGWTSLQALPWIGVAVAVVASVSGGDGDLDDSDVTERLGETAFIGAAYVGFGGALVALEGGDYMTDFRLMVPLLGPLYAAVGCGAAYAWASRRPVMRIVGLGSTAALFLSHFARQMAPTAMFDDAPPPAEHKAILTVTKERAERFRAALALIAEPGDSLVTDWTGFMGYGHTYRTVDCTGLTSPDIAGHFYLRPLRSETGGRERLPGHARWPEVKFMSDSRFTFIFPKVSEKGHDVAEVHKAALRRHRHYPYLHATMGLGGGEYFRFFTTLSADELAARAASKGLDLCWRPPMGALQCPGRDAPAPTPHHDSGDAAPGQRVPDGLVWKGPRTPPKSAEEAVIQFFSAMQAVDCEWMRSVIAGKQAEVARMQTCDEARHQMRSLQPLRLVAIEQVTANRRTTQEQRVARVRLWGTEGERTTNMRVAEVDGIWKVTRY